jgi:hypothetical protein
MFLSACGPLLGQLVAVTQQLGNPLTTNVTLSVPLDANDTLALWVFRELLINRFGGVESTECTRFFTWGPSDVATVPAFLVVLHDRLNYALSLVFLLELVAKLSALGLHGFCKDTFNLFDGAIVVLSIIEIGVMTFTDGPNSPSMISALRAFRLIRMLKLLRRWKTLRALLHTIAMSLESLLPLIFLLIIMIFIAALVGIELFGGEILYYTEMRGSFNSFLPSSSGYGGMLTVFQILTGENWVDVMHMAIRAQGVASFVYFAAVFVIGRYIILNLFLAILLTSTNSTRLREAWCLDGCSIR